MSNLKTYNGREFNRLRGRVEFQTYTSHIRGEMVYVAAIQDLDASASDDLAGFIKMWLDNDYSWVAFDFGKTLRHPAIARAARMQELPFWMKIQKSQLA